MEKEDFIHLTFMLPSVVFYQLLGSHSHVCMWIL